MKKQDTAAFSLIRCDTEKKNARTGGALQSDAALFFAGLLAVARSRRDLDKLRLALGCQCSGRWSWRLDSRAAGSGRYFRCSASSARQSFSGASSREPSAVSSAACETLTKATGHILLPLAGAGADVALFVGILAALLGTLCAYAVRWSPTGCGLLLTVLAAALLALLRPGCSAGLMAVCPALAQLCCWQAGGADRKESVPAAFKLWRAAGSGRRSQLHCWPYRACEAAHCFPSGERLPAPHCTAPVRIRAGCAAGRGVFQFIRRTGADIMPDRHDGAADGALSARLYRRYLHRHGIWSGA